MRQPMFLCLPVSKITRTRYEGILMKSSEHVINGPWSRWLHFGWRSGAVGTLTFGIGTYRQIKTTAWKRLRSRPWLVHSVRRSWTFLPPHLICFWQYDTGLCVCECVCVSLCRGAKAEVLIREAKLSDSSRRWGVAIPPYPQTRIIRATSLSNPCQVTADYANRNVGANRSRLNF